MTADEWPTCADGYAMLEFLRDRGNPRKLRLFAVAACVRGWELLLDPRSRDAVLTAERFADGDASAEDLHAARDAALAARAEVARLAPLTWFNWWGDLAAEAAFACAAPDTFPPLGRPAPQHDYFTTAAGFMGNAIALVRVRQLEEEARLDEPPDDGTLDDARHDLDWAAKCACDDIGRAERAARADLLREIFGDPFSATAFDPAWRTSTAVALAKHLYEAGDFSVAPMLADALQDAGCDDRELLAHMRGATAGHVRGCWAIDRVLGRE